MDKPATTMNRARVMPPPSVCLVKKQIEQHAPELRIRAMFLRSALCSHLT
jgi:hypothetical protein